jgi:hypothetical protein
MSDYFYSLELLLWIATNERNAVAMCGLIADLATEANQ